MTFDLDWLDFLGLYLTLIVIAVGVTFLGIKIAQWFYKR